MTKNQNKTVATKQSVTQFINAVESDRRRTDSKILLKLFKKVTGEKAVMWGPSIIGFGQYHYKYASGREGDFLNVGFSPRKSALTLYVLGSIDEKDPLRAKLGKYKTGKGCLYINKLEDVDMSILEKIIEKSFKKTIERWR